MFYHVIRISQVKFLVHCSYTADAKDILQLSLNFFPLVTANDVIYRFAPELIMNYFISC